MEQDNNRMVQESHRFRRRPLRTFVTVFSLALLAVLWEKDQGGREPETQQDGAGASSQPTDTRPEPADTSPKPHTGDEAALLGVALAGIVALYLGPGPWGWLSSAVGITLILILLAYDPNIRYRQRSQNRWALLKDHWKKHLAFSAVYALSGLVILGIFFDWGWPSKGFPEEPNIITQTGPDLGCRYYDTPDEVVPNIVQGQQIATEQNIQRGQLKCWEEPDARVWPPSSTIQDNPNILVRALNVAGWHFENNVDMVVWLILVMVTFSLRLLWPIGGRAVHYEDGATRRQS